MTRGPWPVAGSVRALLLLLACIGPAAAATTDEPRGRLDLELNRLEDIDGGCRLTLMFTNGLDVNIEAMSVETVLFDAEGRVIRFLLLKPRPLSSGRTRVQQFDIRDLACPAIARVLLNDVTDCVGEGLDPATCLAAINVTSRDGVAFVTAVAGD
ncbi:hypothetical protein [Tepidamorphus gemmatus]|uniref:hypothetical protein n=1 Tax=Tepidamorphus gemmatus TaxID=747076 RepID=UPI001049DAA5|nr:hypothetical protein [Tepidamorphus gemmatus]